MRLLSSEVVYVLLIRMWSTNCVVTSLGQESKEFKSKLLDTLAIRKNNFMSVESNN